MLTEDEGEERAVEDEASLGMDASDEDTDEPSTANALVPWNAKELTPELWRIGSLEAPQLDHIASSRGIDGWLL